MMGGGSFIGGGFFFMPVFMILIWAVTLLAAGLVFKWAVDLFTPQRRTVRSEDNERSGYER